jgi:hypothetical protein
MGEESREVSHPSKKIVRHAIPPMVIPLAFGVAPPSSLSGVPFPAPEPEALTGDERKKSGDCVDADCSLAFLGVA